MEDNLEQHKYLQVKKEPQIHIGANYQAIIPEPIKKNFKDVINKPKHIIDVDRNKAEIINNNKNKINSYKDNKANKDNDLDINFEGSDEDNINKVGPQKKRRIEY